MLNNFNTNNINDNANNNGYVLNDNHFTNQPNNSNDTSNNQLPNSSSNFFKHNGGDYSQPQEVFADLYNPADNSMAQEVPSVSNDSNPFTPNNLSSQSSPKNLNNFINNQPQVQPLNTSVNENAIHKNVSVDTSAFYTNSNNADYQNDLQFNQINGNNNPTVYNNSFNNTPVPSWPNDAGQNSNDLNQNFHFTHIDTAIGNSGDASNTIPAEANPTVLNQFQQAKTNFNPQSPDFSHTQQLSPQTHESNVNKTTNNVTRSSALDINKLLDLVIEKNASDLHITAGYPPFIRVDDILIPVGNAVLTPEDSKTLVSQALTETQLELLEVNKEVDLSYEHSSKNRFRVNAYYQKGTVAGAFRLIPNRIRSVSELGLPEILLDITRLSQGFFLVTGPTGSGKSTTLAAMIQHINENEAKHIITIEDPIEYVYPPCKALVDQRELGGDTHDWNIAMKSALRQDPDVILIGELRDLETIQLAITLAETGHLVFATLHTNSASQSIDRIIDVFPPHQQQQIKIQLASILKGILSQRLVPLIGGGRAAAVELLLVTNAVQNLIREGKTYQIDNVIATGAELGMISMEKSLVKMVREGRITPDTAIDYAIRPEEVQRLLKSSINI